VTPPQRSREGGGGPIQMVVQSRFDPDFTDATRWQRSTGLWLLIAVATFFGSLQFWIFSGYVLCGSDTTEPVLSDSVCHDGDSLPSRYSSQWLSRPFSSSQSAARSR
jgi:hypothetical protein